MAGNGYKFPKASLNHNPDWRLNAGIKDVSVNPSGGGQYAPSEAIVPNTSAIVVEDDSSCCPDCQSRVQDFSEETTIHGVWPILRKDQHRISRVIWAIVFLSTTIACCVLTGKSLNRYLSYEVKTTTKLDSAEEIEFPSVTICNENMLMKSLVGNSKNVIGAFTALIATNLKEYHKKLGQAIRTCWTDKTNQYSDNLNNLGYTWFKKLGINKVMSIFALDSFKSLLKCWMHNRVVPCSNYFLNHITDYGWCFTLNPGHLLLQGFRLGMDYNDTGYGLRPNYHQIKQRSTGPDNGFKVLMHVHQDEYCVTRTDSAGFRILIHDPDVQSLFFLERPLSLAPGFEASVAVRLTRQEKKTQDLGYCVDKLKLGLYPDAKLYYKEACYLECFTNYVYKSCNCTPLYGPPGSNHITAQQLGLVYIPVCWEMTELMCMKAHERNFLNEGLQDNCDTCKDPCEHTRYDLQISTSYFPAEGFRSLYADMLNVSNKINESEQQSYLRKNLVLANFYVESMEMTVITETQAFKIDQLVADIGGQVGFLLGMSILSVVEFLQCFVPRNRTNRKKSRDEDGSGYPGKKKKSSRRRRRY